MVLWGIREAGASEGTAHREEKQGWVGLCSTIGGGAGGVHVFAAAEMLFCCEKMVCGGNGGLCVLFTLIKTTICSFLFRFVCLGGRGGSFARLWRVWWPLRQSYEYFGSINSAIQCIRSIYVLTVGGGEGRGVYARFDTQNTV